MSQFAIARLRKVVLGSRGQEAVIHKHVLDVRHRRDDRMGLFCSLYATVAAIDCC